MLLSKAYLAGVHPAEVYELTLKEIIMMVEAYNQRQIDHFNLNTRTIAWHSIAPHVKQGSLPPFERFLSIGNDGVKSQSISERAAFIRNKYKELGYL